MFVLYVFVMISGSSCWELLGLAWKLLGVMVEVGSYWEFVCELLLMLLGIVGRLVGVGEEFVGVVWSLLAVTWNC